MTLIANLLNTNPMLVKPPSNFRLQGGSPARDSGETLSDVPLDFDAVGRPQGPGHDRGAFEFH